MMVDNTILIMSSIYRIIYRIDYVTGSLTLSYDPNGFRPYAALVNYDGSFLVGFDDSSVKHYSK